MAKRGSRKYELYLDLDVVDTLLETSATRDIQLDRALNQIVREWGENKNIEPLNSSLKSPTLSEIEDKLNRIDKRLNWIENVLADADITIVKSE